MPGGTQKYGLPYLLNTEGLWTIGNVTKLLAERLEALIDNGTLKGNPGAPGGPNGPAASITANAFGAASGQLLYLFDSPPLVEYDLRSPTTAHASPYGLTIRRDGIYLVTIVMPWGTNNANGQRVVKLVDGADNNVLAEDVRPGSAIEQISQLSVVMPFAAGRRLVSHVYQNSGATLNAGGTQLGGVKTRMTITWLGPSS